MKRMPSPIPASLSELIGLPFDLVPLASLPVETWLGRTVFSPMLQTGEVPHWVPANYPDPVWDPVSDTSKLPAFDVGVVIGIDTENWRNEPDNPRAHEVTFLTGTTEVGDGVSTLHYGAWSLWTPAPSHSPSEDSSSD